jgi:RHS repeat-associated protein
VYTYYAGRYEELRNGSSSSAGTPTYYIWAGGQRVASLTSGTYSYTLQDHLGGTALTTNASGYVTQIYDYYPYGSELTNTALSTTDAKHSFTDKELDDTLGLYYFEARWYDADIGRFMSQDPAQLDDRVFKLITDPQSLNFYAYSRNNPVNLTDPSGESWWNPTTWNWQAASHRAGQILEMLPVTGDVCDVYSLAFGETPFTQELVSNVDKGIVVVAALIPGLTGGEAKAIKTGVETIIQGASQTKSGLVEQWLKGGDFDQAVKDFEDLVGDGKIVTHELSDGRIVKSAELPNGGSASVRNFSSEGSPTVQVNYDDGSKVKVRYNDQE